MRSGYRFLRKSNSFIPENLVASPVEITGIQEQEYPPPTRVEEMYKNRILIPRKRIPLARFNPVAEVII